MIIEKKVWPEFFQKILEGDKTFELRLADFECKPGDILVLREWDPKTKEYTGRVIKKKATYVIKTKDVKFWSEKDIKKYGFQIIGLETKTLDRIQNEVEEFCQTYNLVSPPEYRVLDLVNEVGEVAKEVLKMTEYGTKPLQFREEIISEIGDAFYSLITVANYFNVNLEEALKMVIKKYKQRISKGGKPGSEYD